MKRFKRLLLMVGLAAGLSCLPPSQNPITDDATVDTQGEQVSAATPEGTQCHSGTFECADGSVVTACGTWFFDVSEEDAIVGAGEITSGLPGVPITVRLSGSFDPTNPIIEVILTSAEDGSGEMHLSYVGPTLEIIGNWSFTSGPEPEGVEIGGGAAGASCTVIP
jgi:hypothetical protein